MNPALNTLLDTVRQQPGAALAAALGAYLFLLLLVVWALVRQSGLMRRQARLMRGTEGGSIEQMLRDQMEGAETVRSQIAGASERGASNEASLRLCLQKVGLLRYDAFPDMGGEQSFSIALLDSGDNGLVVSGLTSRHDMRVYAKPVVGGVSAFSLTDEERRAIATSAAGGPTTTPPAMATNGRGR